MYWQAETSRSLLPRLSLPTSRDWNYLPQSQSIFHHQCVRGKAIKTALLFLSIMRISTRFSEIPPRAVEILGIFPLKCFLMGCSEVSETLVRLQCSFGISVYLFGAEVTKLEVWVHLNFPYNQTETHSPVHYYIIGTVYSNNSSVHFTFFLHLLISE